MDRLDLKASILAEKVRHHLVLNSDHLLDEASDCEFYQAISSALREEIVANWAATRHSYAKHNQRILYYLSMEYLPGRMLGNTITNLQANELVARVVKKLGREWPNIVACEGDPGLGNGGLGRLASCFLDSLATLKYPAMGYGLRYQYGIFEQEFVDGVQVERPDRWLLTENPWEPRRDFFAADVEYCGRLEGSRIAAPEKVRALPYDTPIIGYCRDQDFSVITLRLWSTKESPRNFELQRYNAGRLDQAAENTTLTDVLYPADYHEYGKRVRLKQEFLLVSASVQDIIRHYLSAQQNFNDFSDKVRIQINDTHPAVAVAELMRLLTTEHGIGWDTAWEMTTNVMGYTNHTVLREALEEWDQELFSYLLPRQYKLIERINDDFCTKIRKKFPGDEERVHRMSILEGGRVKMAHLSIFGSHKINGVAALHTQILKDSIFKDFYEMYPERFVNVTNGVTQRRWLLHCNPPLADFITARIGDGWITNFQEMRKLSEFAKDEQSQQEFLNIKRQNKELLDFDADSLYDIHIKRIHEYKRQLMNALHAIILYHELLENPEARKIKRSVIFGGKAAASYAMAKNILRLIHCMGRRINSDPVIKDKLKIILIENYNISKAERLIPAAELSEQISTAGLEASGTGNMKFAMNGALTIGTDDGANVEMREEVGDEWWPFLFGASSEEIHTLKTSDTYSAWDMCTDHPRIRKAVESLRDRTFAIDEDEHKAFEEIYQSLVEGHYGSSPDPYFVLHDLPSYYETHKRVEELYQSPHRWAEYAIHNMAGMGKFSTDRSIQDYAEHVWGLEPLSTPAEEIQRIRAQYAEHVPTLTL